MRRRPSLIQALNNSIDLCEMLEYQTKPIIRPNYAHQAATLAKMGRRSSINPTTLGRSDSCVIKIFPPDYFLERQTVFLNDGFSTVTNHSKMLRRKTVVPGNYQPQSSKYEMEWNPLSPEHCKQYQNHHPTNHLMRTKLHSKDRRSRSQPQHRVENIPDIERYSMDSETSGSNDSGIRSSTHSAASSAGASSLIDNQQTQDEQMLIVEAVWDHVAMLADELPFAQGDIITVLDATSNSGLWYGICRDRTGWFPASYVRMRNDETARPNINSLIKDEDYPETVKYQRRRVIQELIETEKDYVKLLQDLVHGFLEQCKRRKEMFDEDRISRIFGNLLQIYNLHTKLLKELESSYDVEQPENSVIANAFLRNACRLLRGMSKLTLEGFLLTPVQRICRYPLQLFELLKSTPTNHIDRIPLEQAHRTMRAVAAHINDAKRRVDGIQKIILWQKNVHGFRGPDIIENNHRTLISGELHCRALMKKSVQWSKPVHVYLFDQSIVLCKKDVLKKNSLVFKERMSLQTATVIDLNDGKEPITGANLKNSFKLGSPVREYIFTCPDPATKGIWLETLRTRPKPMPPTNAEKRLAIVMMPN